MNEQQFSRGRLRKGSVQRTERHPDEKEQSRTVKERPQHLSDHSPDFGEPVGQGENAELPDDPHQYYQHRRSKNITEEPCREKVTEKRQHENRQDQQDDQQWRYDLLGADPAIQAAQQRDECRIGVEPVKFRLVLFPDQGGKMDLPPEIRRADRGRIHFADLPGRHPDRINRQCRGCLFLSVHGHTSAFSMIMRTSLR